MYSKLYKVDIEKLVSDISNEKYIGLINEEAGGIIAYYPESLAFAFASYLVWEMPVFGHHINSIEHEEWDGWQSRGWDIDQINSMLENLRLNGKCKNDVMMNPIKVNGFGIGYAVNDDFRKLQEEFLSAFCVDTRSGLDIDRLRLAL
ncbi:hypothetical protein [Vibrio owensii]|uniref:hypothetical protein n=1 Tax=Vibrio owensii TaxID=696485 RepID=UPI003CC6DB67